MTDIELTNADWLAIEKATFEESLYEFVKAAWHVLEPGTEFVDGWYIRVICDRLEAAARGDVTRLAISIPPGHMKSLLVSVFFNAWVWTHSPHKRFLSTSSSEGFCERDNGKLRDLIRSDWYQARWPITFPQVDTLLRFVNSNTGFRWAKSYSSLTGGRANFFCLDDILPADSANSELERTTANRRFFETATDRLDAERDAIIIIMQRIHEADLIGEIMRRQSEGENLGFEFVNIPMEYDGPNIHAVGWTDPRKKAGEILSPKYKSQAWVDREKVTKGPYAWAAQYQQDPVPRGSGIFDTSKFHRFRLADHPLTLNHYITTDHAMGISMKGDYNVVQVWGLDCDKNLWLVDSFREICTPHQMLGLKSSTNGRYEIGDRGVFAMIRKYKPIAWFADADPIIKSNVELVMDIMRTVPGCHTRFEIVAHKARAKEERASALQVQADLGRIHIPYGAEGDSLLMELGAFPAGRHNDQVDAAALLPRMQTHAAYIAPDDPILLADYINANSDRDDGDVSLNYF